ncbi:MAG: hypothetical protein HOG20_03090 [Candidatus Marinimicrobia bacterium]|jgi:hypothetical protein|nr:hypothetical protein [Candidatus Neomarinimicrobiota bacterium]MBT3692189.1 hypothetical protein [Candidatus Neomarinimicrobiota bacterium]MBT3732847.1 hypothetical protein [Candidatus Neomarinimicrobiota bacterium]MBT4991078.1 hypothetical protein [Candidatus Neomarinimicrobiota bacterium]MBT5355078.1 hypothetical protein [Candidatus Neomarinimicrobiota bacterium]
MRLYSLFLILAVQFSFCPESPRMVRYFSYDGSQVEATQNMKKYLDREGIPIKHFAPESGYILTEPLETKINFATYEIQLSIHVEDRVKLYLISSKEIYSRGSEISIGGGAFNRKQSMDKLPYKIQRKIYSSFYRSLKRAGFRLIES